MVTAINIGDEATHGPITIKDTLPSGLALPAGVNSVLAFRSYFKAPGSFFECKLEGVTVVTVVCPTETKVPPYEAVEMILSVNVQAASGTLTDQAQIEGGGAQPESSSQPLEVNEKPAPFGIERFEMKPEEEDGSRDMRAGSHPFQLTTTLNTNQTLEEDPLRGFEPSSAQLLKDVHVKLPPGLIGAANPEVIPRCSDRDFSTKVGNGNACAADTAVGVAVVHINEPANAGFILKSVPVFNLEPAPGEPARFGFEVVNVPEILTTAVASGGDYSVTTSVTNASQAAQVLGSTVTLWGEPGDPRHDHSRGWDCLVEGHNVNGKTCPEEPRHDVPFLSMPTACNQPLLSSVLIDAWTGPTTPGEEELATDTGSRRQTDSPRRLPSASFQSGNQSGTGNARGEHAERFHRGCARAAGTDPRTGWSCRGDGQGIDREPSAGRAAQPRRGDRARNLLQRTGRLPGAAGRIRTENTDADVHPDPARTAGTGGQFLSERVEGGRRAHQDARPGQRTRRRRLSRRRRTPTPSGRCSRCTSSPRTP